MIMVFVTDAARITMSGYGIYRIGSIISNTNSGGGLKTRCIQNAIRAGKQNGYSGKRKGIIQGVYHFNMFGKIKIDTASYAKLEFEQQRRTQ